MNRYMRAAAAGSLAILAVIALGIIGIATIGYDDQSITLAGIGHLLFFLMLFGWPVVFVACAATALFLWRFGIASNPAATIREMGIAAFLGAALVPVVWAIVWGDSTDLTPMIAVGALAGAAAGHVFRQILRK